METSTLMYDGVRERERGRWREGGGEGDLCVLATGERTLRICLAMTVYTHPSPLLPPPAASLAVT